MKIVADYLRQVKKGVKLYSPIFGECEFDHISPSDSIYVRYKDTQIEFNKYGQFSIDNPDGECLLFPSKKVREWTKYQLPVLYDFKPFDKIVARFRPSSHNHWQADFFSHWLNKSDAMGISGSFYGEVLPFNTETVKLIGTNKEKTSLIL
jgi:hypothetical protein